MDKKQDLFGSKEDIFETMTYRLKSSKKIEDLVESIQKACDSNKFSLLHSYDYNALLKSKGFPIERKAYVYEVCQAKVASDVLRLEPMFTPFMPCRIALYEEGENVEVSTQNLDLLISSLKEGSELHKTMSTMFSTLKLIMAEIIE
ncbi:DUF302 domain-containing protein [Sulfurimonas aquatica]|uniref:DUF302 domain-containing protein n=1 Tax=Sulfurimonas aquatica TaxID=2672570 RepID=A0A975AZ33_9BACT|nr:DUF302 domain-containing protein [Sulfurimonas aquatica]QSZ41148.1 DUF302 domain-containing protein [Sulfurimonas aquatica]